MNGMPIPLKYVWIVVKKIWLILQSHPVNVQCIVIPGFDSFHQIVKETWF